MWNCYYLVFVEKAIQCASLLLFFLSLVAQFILQCFFRFFHRFWIFFLQMCWIVQNPNSKMIVFWFFFSCDDLLVSTLRSVNIESERHDRNSKENRKNANEMKEDRWLVSMRCKTSIVRIMWWIYCISKHSKHIYSFWRQTRVRKRVKKRPIHAENIQKIFKKPFFRWLMFKPIKIQCTHQLHTAERRRRHIKQ